MIRKTQINELSFWDHLEDLRRKLLWVIGWFVLFFFLSYFFLAQKIISHLLFLSRQPLYYLSVFEPFLTRIKVSTYVSILGALPLIIVQVTRFILPGLLKSERVLYLVLLAVLLLLFFGLGWLLYTYSPLLMEYFLNTFAAEGVEYRLSISTYISFFVMLFAADILLVLIPLLAFLLLKTGILDLKALGKSRKAVIPILLFISALVTPPDPVTMVVVFIPLWIVYEMSLLVFRLLVRPKG